MKNNKQILEYNFLRLLCATIIKESNKPIINRNELQEKLYNYYDLEDYKILFHNLDKIDEENNKYIDLSGAFLSAYAYGLLTMIHDESKAVKYIINMEDKDALKELDKYTEEEKIASINLVNELYLSEELDKQNKPRKIAKILVNNSNKKED